MYHFQTLTLEPYINIALPRLLVYWLGQAIDIRAYLSVTTSDTDTY